MMCNLLNSEVISYVKFYFCFDETAQDAKKAEPDSSGRLKEIIAVLRKYNYDDVITSEIAVNILQDLGPTFVKIGQIASQQAEYLPPEYCNALSKLRLKVAPMDIETVNAQIEKYLGNR